LNLSLTDRNQLYNGKFRSWRSYFYFRISNIINSIALNILIRIRLNDNNFLLKCCFDFAIVIISVRNTRSYCNIYNYVLFSLSFSNLFSLSFVTCRSYIQTKDVLFFSLVWEAVYVEVIVCGAYFIEEKRIKFKDNLNND
jgi:hypothetical protein